MEYVHVRINEEGTLRNQRFAFSDRFTLVTELLQNARRAGATLIEVSHDPASRTLRVLDDGHGIEDFSKLLTFNESGWSEALQAEEHPFGAGFSRCLYAATRCTVTSRGRRIDFATAEALARSRIAVEEVSDGSGTGMLVELEGVDLPDLPTRIAELCRGFPVPVEFNGQPVDRPHASHRLSPLPTPIGEISLTGAHSGRYAVSVVAYLQGFRVMHLPNYLAWDEVPNVIHLDSKVFFARLPDRDSLIDADVQELKVREQIKLAWRETLLQRKAELAAAEFAEDFFGVMRYHQHLELLDDVDVLPRQVCERISGYPFRTRSPQGEFLERLPQPLAREHVEGGLTRLARLDWPDGDNGAKWMLARAKGYVVTASDHLSPAHWAQPHVIDLNAQEVDVRVTNERQHSSLDGRWISAEVVLCDAITVRVGDDEATFAEEGLYHDGTLYIPAGESSGQAVRQCASYLDGNDRFYEADMDADIADLEHQIRRLRMADPVEAMRSLLADMQSGRYPRLRGLSFHIRIADDAEGTDTVELLD